MRIYYPPVANLKTPFYKYSKGKKMEKKQSSSQPTGVIIQRFRHDNEIEAIYIKLREGKVSKSKRSAPTGSRR